VLNATFNTISAISWRPVLVVEDQKKSQYEFNQYLLNFNLKKKEMNYTFILFGEGARVAQ
jgi:hypothetical protein